MPLRLAFREFIKPVVIRRAIGLRLFSNGTFLSAVRKLPAGFGVLSNFTMHTDGWYARNYRD